MKLNKKGFTLVELLAVIVILAIIMVIAVPAVVTQMQKAKKSSFRIYGEKVLNTAMSSYQADNLDGTFSGSAATLADTTNAPAGYTNVHCYSFTDLGLAATGNYKGYVIAATDSTSKAVYYLYLTDGSFHFKGAEFSKVNDPKTNIDGGDTAISAISTTSCASTCKDGFDQCS